jgi:hypothetical protein
MKYGNVYKKGGILGATINFNEESSNGRFDIFEIKTGKWLIYGNIIGANVYIYEAKTSNVIRGSISRSRINFSENPYDFDYALF